MAALCLRATATPDDIKQPYSADFVPGNDCRYFIPRPEGENDGKHDRKGG